MRLARDRIKGLEQLRFFKTVSAETAAFVGSLGARFSRPFPPLLPLIRREE
jgi:hypothetical protein